MLAINSGPASLTEKQKEREGDSVDKWGWEREESERRKKRVVCELKVKQVFFYQSARLIKRL